MPPSPDANAQLVLERDFLRRLLELAHHENPQALLGDALELVARISRARLAYIELRTTDSRSSPHARYAATHGEVDATSVRRMLSTTIMESALASGRTVKTRASLDDRFSAAPSVIRQRIDAVVCVPIGERASVGVLYLQGSDDAAGFAEDVVERCELFARHIAPMASRLLRHPSETPGDPTTAARARLVGAERIVGTSHALAHVLSEAVRAAPRDIAVLISGPSGTGKTALARVIADSGPRSGCAFVELNCANFQDTLVESNLFGALPGSFSGATKRIRGKIEAAEKGTLFLDEIGELTPMAQAKLLQFCQDKTYFPLGATTPSRADVRIIAATNANLLERVRAGSFREDLYYRLCVLSIVMPSLEQRRIDIAPLAEYFLRQKCEALDLGALVWSDRSLRLLESSEWPGQIRQLENAVEAAAVRAFADGLTIIEPQHLFPGQAARPVEAHSFHALMRGYQRQVIVDALTRHDWNISTTASSLDLGRSSLYLLLDKLEIERPDAAHRDR